MVWQDFGVIAGCVFVIALAFLLVDGGGYR